MTLHVKSETNPDAGLSAHPPSHGSGLRVLAVLVFLGVLAGAGWIWSRQHGASVPSAGRPGGPGTGASYAVPVVAGTVEQRDMPIYLEG